MPLNGIFFGDVASIRVFASFTSSSRGYEGCQRFRLAPVVLYILFRMFPVIRRCCILLLLLIHLFSVFLLGFRSYLFMFSVCTHIYLTHGQLPSMCWVINLHYDSIVLQCCHPACRHDLSLMQVQHYFYTSSTNTAELQLSCMKSRSRMLSVRTEVGIKKLILSIIIKLTTPRTLLLL